MRRIIMSSLLGAGLTVSCGGNAEKKADDKAEAKDDGGDKEPAASDDAEKAEPAEKQAGAKPLSAEDQKLIDADPSTLSEEDRIKRGQALRRKIMQNPDSEQAQAIRDGAAAIEAGEVAVPDHIKTDNGETKAPGMVLSAPKPSGPRK